jgi:hypothetical protein
MSRRFIAPVTSRVEDRTTDQILRNHDERIRELVRMAGQGPIRRRYPGAALLTNSETQDFTRSNGKFTANDSFVATFAPAVVERERLTRVEVLAQAPTDSISLSLRYTDPYGTVTPIGPTVTTVGAETELLTLACNVVLDPDDFRPVFLWVSFGAAGQIVHGFRLISEPG